jgi:hypothetical protein
MTLRGAVVAGVIMSVAMMIACSGGDGITMDAFMLRVSALASELDREPAGDATSVAGGSAEARAIVGIEARLRTFEAGLDGLQPPSDAADAHHDLTVASRNLADAVAGEGTNAAVFVRDWGDACHRMQDLAWTREIDVDLRCSTAGVGGVVRN